MDFRAMLKKKKYAKNQLDDQVPSVRKLFFLFITDNEAQSITRDHIPSTTFSL
jgi:hypothetical protein